METEKAIGEKLMQLRTERAETQEQVAACIGISSVSLSRYETGSRMPKMNILAKLAKHYEETVDEIIGSEETKKDPAENQLDQKLIEMLVNLSPDEVQRVQDFVAGMKASHKA